MDRGACWDTVHGLPEKVMTEVKSLHSYTSTFIPGDPVIKKHQSFSSLTLVLVLLENTSFLSCGPQHLTLSLSEAQRVEHKLLSL